MGFDNFGLEYSNPDFVLYAESFGAKGYRPDSVEGFVNTLDDIIDKKGVHLIDVAVDYSMNHPILNELLKNKSCLV